MRLLVINLPRRADRRAQFEKWNTREGLELDFVDAVDGASLDRAQLQASGLLDAEHAGFTAGAIGNALSHLAIWQRAAQHRDATLVCEDDACLRGDFVERAQALLACLDVPWDIVYFGYNTDAFMPLHMRDGLVSVVSFDEGAKHRPDYFRRFSRTRAPAPAPLRCQQMWGTLCYAVSAEGARRLLEACFPLGGQRDIELAGRQARLRPYSLDGMINLALQDRRVRGFCAFPPIAVSANAVADSDVVPA
ncbi:MAG: glycosyltransferase family 25 protein [Xanthomonadales bacterium]|nr:glycosyltransferase family 25 protein [Xanthomonadales bacterium]